MVRGIGLTIVDRWDKVEDFSYTLEANQGSTFSMVAVKARSASISALVRSNNDMDSEFDEVAAVVAIFGRDQQE